MVLLLAHPVFAAVAITHRYLQPDALTNLLARHVGEPAPSVRTGAALFALAAALLIAMHAVAEAVAAGASGSLNLIVLVWARGAIKIGWFALWVGGDACARQLRRVGSAFTRKQPTRQSRRQIRGVSAAGTARV
jgi:hypothetical protein